MEPSSNAKILTDGKRYVYPNFFLQLLPGYLFTSMGLVFLGSGIYMAIRHAPTENLWLAFFFGTIVTLMGSRGIQLFFGRTRPIVIHEQGIAALSCNKIWKWIPWTDVERIEQTRTLSVVDDGWYNELSIVSARDRIYIDHSIQELPALLADLNAYSQRYHISLLSIDKGDDTRAKIKATVMDKQERKKLLKEGVQSSISTL